MIKMEERVNAKEHFKMRRKASEDDEDDEHEREPLEKGKEMGFDEPTEDEHRRSVKRFLILSISTFSAFVIFVLIVSFLIYDGDNWMVDKYTRYIRLVPTPNAPKNMIAFTASSMKPTRDHRWPSLTGEMRDFLDSYDYQKTLTGFKNISTCDHLNLPKEHEVCHWNTDEIQSLCKSNENFGYPEGSPCFFIVFKHVWNFQVEPYNLSETDIISQLTSDSLLNYRIGQSYMFLECRGNTPVDVENAGKIEFAPASQEFPKFFFPYTGHPHYMAPFIAIRLVRPQRNVAIGITCRLWAKNLTHTNGYSPAELPFNVYIE